MQMLISTENAFLPAVEDAEQLKSLAAVVQIAVPSMGASKGINCLLGNFASQAFLRMMRASEYPNALFQLAGRFEKAITAAECPVLAVVEPAGSKARLNPEP